MLLPFEYWPIGPALDMGAGLFSGSNPSLSSTHIYSTLSLEDR